MTIEVLHPPGWPQPKGYAYGMKAGGQLVFISGMVGWNADNQFETESLPGQIRQALANVVAVLKEAGAGPAQVVRMTWYLRDKREYLAATREIGEAYRHVMGRHFPAMTVVEVSDLLEEQARIEIEATAVIPEK